MSKKKSNKNTAANTLDDNMINEPVEQKVADGKEVSLKEFMKNGPFAFNSKNYKLLFIGLAVNILGFILMIGGGSDDPTKFDGEALFSHTRITIAPMLIVAGYIVIMYALMKKPKANADQ